VTATLDLAPWTDRILDDGTDRERWLAARANGVIGASDAAKLAKLSSVPLYLAQKLSDRAFTGNSYTASGNEWEPDMLAWAGIPGNTALIHSPSEPGFASTPDGAQVTLSGARGAECKAKHNKVVMGPTLGEWRQLGWQLETVPEFDEIEFIWAELVIDRDTGGWILRGNEPKSLTIKRNNPKVQAELAKVRPIATELLRQLRAALEFERGM
jgi:hypothetical protein